MKRRQFLAVAGSSLLLGKFLLPDLAAREPSVVGVAEGSDFGAITRKVVDTLGGFRKFVNPGDVVVVKPNIGWDRRPEQAATTHPTVVKTVAEECVRAGAKLVKVFDNPCNEMRRCYESSGIAAALKGMARVEVKYMDDEKYRKISLKGKALKEWELYGEALSADVFINVPIAKVHSMSVLTLGLKNLMGIMGGNRGYIHRQMDEALTDVASVVRSNLVLVDATRILVAHGPTGGSLKDVRVLNRVVASTDIVAADAYATTFFGLQPKDVPSTVAAFRRGLGEMNLEKIRILKA